MCNLLSSFASKRYKFIHHPAPREGTFPPETLHMSIHKGVPLAVKRTDASWNKWSLLCPWGLKENISTLKGLPVSHKKSLLRLVPETNFYHHTLSPGGNGGDPSTASMFAAGQASADLHNLKLGFICPQTNKYTQLSSQKPESRARVRKN